MHSDPAQEAAPPPVITRRQRHICRAYFAHGCRTLATAEALHIGPRRVREVKSLPACVLYLDTIEAESVRLLAQAQAARLLAPMLP